MNETSGNTDTQKGWLKKLDFNRLQSAISIDNLMRNLPFLLFLAALAVVYIANTHMAERTIRKINQTDKELKELRWEFMTLKSELMFESKQSEVAKMVESDGLKELTAPPKKILVERKNRK